jgi:hypothetical protein
VIELFIINVCYYIMCFGMSRETKFRANNIIPEIRGAHSDKDVYFVLLLVIRVIL